MEWFWEQYLEGDEDAASPYILLAGILPNGDEAFDKAQATLQDMFAPARNDEGATR
jgi:hypothetical protein